MQRTLERSYPVSTKPGSTPVAPLFSSLPVQDALPFPPTLGSPVSLDYFDKAPFKFNGKIEQVQVKYIVAR
jgi:hypothetical protein